MKVLAVDDEKLALTGLVHKLMEIPEITEIVQFTDPLKMLEYLENNEVDVCFLDIEMPGTNGLEMAKQIKEKHPSSLIVFVTAFSSYAVEAFRLHAGGYLMKPVMASDIVEVLQYLKNPDRITDGKRVVVQAFGNFSVYVDGEPVKFKYSKSRELFAYLVDRRGASIVTGELLSVLWEAEPNSPTVRSYLRNVVGDMQKTFSSAGIEGLFYKTRGGIALNTALIDCDYYAYLKGDAKAVNAYRGEYMTNYSWAEFTLAGLVQES